ncbi:tripartite tricarboxylate transporter substrate binding protein [Ramlibacter sp. G-1-2-2]|uniref:Tripartite tricarboxylate transporter substrate binding protein n=1 Tax=Ramlibacter agri TaxID=2728837 RepID=A0A848HGB4_9BURK|nr:tripartite tricarboxylate transporter substrate binding protein [Ramlibacter agri]NML47563.1 tripartite tricarboxylate transporter substrate binding protein [Ramlibacter agri]
MQFSRRSLLAAAAAPALSALPLLARAQYPDHPVRFVVPYSPGGPASTLARYLSVKLQQSTGQPFVIENKPGAGLTIGAQAVATAPADGYTLLVNASSMYVPTSFGGRTPADNLKDFAPVTIVGSFPLLLVVSGSLPVKSVPELIAYAKANPGKLSYGSSGNGSLTHLAAALFAHTAGVEMLHVPYRGITEALVDVSAGRVQLAFGGLPTTLPLTTTGKMRPLAVTSLQRTAAAPQIPAVAEGGLPGYEVNPWYGVVAPAGTPAPVLARLHQEVSTVMQAPEVREQWKTWGADPSTSKTPEDFAALMQKENAKWTAFVKQSGIKLE